MLRLQVFLDCAQLIGMMMGLFAAVIAQGLPAACAGHSTVVADEDESLGLEGCYEQLRVGLGEGKGLAAKYRALNLAESLADIVRYPCEHFLLWPGRPVAIPYGTNLT